MEIRQVDVQPIYVQIAQQLREQVESGEWMEGDRIPGQLELASTYQVSRVTIRQAIALLVKEGVLVTRQGKGTFVAANNVSQDLGNLLSLSEILEAQGANHRISIVGYQWCFPPDDVRSALAVPTGEPALRVQRLHMANDRPIAYASIYLPARIGVGLSRDQLAERPIYELMVQRLGVQPGSAVQRIRAVAADGKAGRLLGVPPGTPLLWAERVTHDEAGEPIEHITFFYLSDRYQFTVKLQRSSEISCILPR